MKIIKIDDVEYTYENIEGRDVLKTYDKKYKVWVVLKFGFNDSKFDEFKEYIKQIVLEKIA